MKQKTGLFILITYFLLSTALFSIDKIDDLSFSNIEINQVLKTISEIFGVTIVTDSDLKGNVTRYFKDTNLETTLTLLLEPMSYVYEIKDGIYYVKKTLPFKIEIDEAKKTFTINSKIASIKDILDRLSILSKETIIFDGNTNENVTIHIFDQNLSESLNILANSIGYKSTKKEGYYLFKKDEEQTLDIFDPKSMKKVIINGTEDNIEIKLNNQSSNTIILSLFNKFQKELGLLSNNSTVIPFLDISDIKFDELLDLIVSYSNQAYMKKENKYFIFNSISKSKDNSFVTVEQYKLKNLDYKNFQMFVPPQLVPLSSFKIDDENNFVYIMGSPLEVESYINIIKNIDDNRDNFKLRVFKLKFLDVKNIKKYLPPRFQNINITVMEETNSFFTILDEADSLAISNHLETIDKSIESYIYRFKYLKVDDVLKSFMPPYINKSQVIANNNDSSLTFFISEGLKEKIFKYFDEIDKPTPIIRYQLLIVEYIHKNKFKFDWGFGLKNGTGDLNLSGGVFNGDDTISANFDFPTIFGAYFTSKLEYQLTEEQAKIQMATEVYGISGETVLITNTQTLQYKDYITDANDEKKPVYGSTTFGLNLEIKGRTTNSNEVFLEVSARISDQLAGKTSGEAPDTSEKSVKNSIRTFTGKPIMLGGLTSKKENIKNNKLPGLGMIPYIGNAFKTHDNSYTNSEFVIYIIPFIQKTEDELKKERMDFVEELYSYFCKRNVDESTK